MAFARVLSHTTSTLTLLSLFGIIPVGIKDVIEVSLVSYVLYRLYLFMRGTIAVQIFLGIGALFLTRLLVRVLDFTMLGVIFDSLSRVFVLAVIILFQPEIRRLLLMLGQNPLVRRFVSSPEQQELMTEVVDAVERMSNQRIGALLVFERTTGLRNYIETGALLQAQPTSDLLVTIFHGQNPLHDGATIIQNRRVEAARCILPVSTSMRLSPQMGLRHRAAVGLTEQTDAFVVVVSEETGHISVSEDGALDTNLSLDAFRQRFFEALSSGAAPTSKQELSAVGA